MEETYQNIRREVRTLLDDYLPDYEFNHIHYNTRSGKILVCIDVKYKGRKHPINALELSIKEVANSLKNEWRITKTSIDDLSRALENINKLNSYFDV